MPVMEPDLDRGTLKAWAQLIDGGAFSSLCWGERIAFDNPESLTLLGVPYATMNAQVMARMGIPCFTAGTLIDTPSGPRAVEELRPGDLVTTRDHGPAPLLWAGASRLP